MSYTEQETLLQGIMINQTNNDTLTGKEYLVRGATVECSKGNAPCVINLPQDHGKYILGSPALSAADKNKANIGGFGICDGEVSCNPCITENWININKSERIFDHNILEEIGSSHVGSYLICSNGGKIEVKDSGQPVIKKRKIPAGFIPEIKEYDMGVMPTQDGWFCFIPQRTGHYNINLNLGDGKPIRNIQVFKKEGLLGNMALICNVDKEDFKSSQWPPYYGRIELWLDHSKTYYITLESDYDSVHYIFVEGNLDRQNFNYEVAAVWKPVSRIPGTIGYSILQRTYWTKELVSLLYFALFDKETTEGKFRENRDKWVGWVRDAYISYIGYTMGSGGDAGSSKGKKFIAAASSYFGSQLLNLAFDLTDLTDLEKNNIKEKGKMIKVAKSGFELMEATCGILLIQSQVMNKGGSMSGSVVMESWDEDYIEGEKYYRGIIEESGHVIWRNLF